VGEKKGERKRSGLTGYNNARGEGKRKKRKGKSESLLIHGRKTGQSPKGSENKLIFIFSFTEIWGGRKEKRGERTNQVPLCMNLFQMEQDRVKKKKKEEEVQYFLRKRNMRYSLLLRREQRHHHDIIAKGGQKKRKKGGSLFFCP